MELEETKKLRKYLKSELIVRFSSLSMRREEERTMSKKMG